MAHVMSDILSATDDPARDERPKGAAEQPAQPEEGTWADRAEETAGAPFGVAGENARPFKGMAAVIILLFWATQFTTLSLMRMVRAPEMEGWANLQARAIVTSCAILLSFAILAVLRRVRGSTLLRRVLIAVGLALGGAAVHAAVNISVFYFLLPPMPDLEWMWAEVALSYPLLINDFFWHYAAISVLLLALTYGEDLVASERRVAALRVQANSAQLNALRYQLNPHFLFNTLNSVASLISKRQSGDAETMVVNLSDFLRSTLKLDAGREIALDDEIQLQALYLDIEKIRFPQRLRVTIDVPEEVRGALVPNLITQPLIENAIKYGVARSSEPVHLEIVAREKDNCLWLEVRDDGGNAVDADTQGTRVGLRNVSRRLRLHFGEEARLEAGARTEGGFFARMVLPLRRA